MKVKLNTLSIFALLCSVLTLTSCDQTTSETSNSSEANKLIQVVNVTSFNQNTLEGVKISLYKDDTLISSSISDSDGKAAISVDNYDIYKIVLTEAKPGYKLDNDYYTSSDGEDVTINCVTSVIEEELPLNLDFYQLGNVVYDFSYIECEGNETTSISSILKEKKILVLNFFYITCKYCVLEFPVIEEGYQLYKDEISVLALSQQDTSSQIADFKQDELLTFDLASDNNLLNFFFPVRVYPTTFIIDRYGVIAHISTDYFKSIEDFNKTIEPFLDDDYVPTVTDHNLN